MTPRSKGILKVLACYWFASICMMVLAFGEPHPHLSYANSSVFTVLYAPFIAAMTVPLMIFGIFSPKAWPTILSFWVPFLVALSLAFKRPERWYQVLKRD